MKFSLTKGDKIFLVGLGAGYIIIFVVMKIIGHTYSLEGLGERWIVQLPFGSGLFSRINPMTLFVSWALMAFLIIFALSIKKFERIPGNKQSLIEMLLEYLFELTEDTIPKKEFVKPTFYITSTLFLFIILSNFLGAMPGIDTVPTEDGIKFTLFQSSWYSPTSDLNTNATLAVFVLIISHAFAIKAKGFLTWLKTFFEPYPVMLPMNLISEIAKPISHSLRLFGNVMGGGLLALIISYLVKYYLVPTILWGFFGIFIGAIQALVFTVLAIAYIGSVIE
ncbi:MAG: F0F1 ATP synthase subunit A [Kosmotogaceae bacterium]